MITGQYQWRGGTEHFLQFGADAHIKLLILPALFEEANRMRRFTVSLMRALADRQIGTILPDLPGTGESLVDIGDITMADWQEAVARLDNNLTVAIRGGAMLDANATAGWRLAPESGERLLRDMVRASAYSSGTTASDLDKSAQTSLTALAGNLISPALYNEFKSATPASGNYRVARLDDDAGDRDVTLSGAKLWRAAEPGDDPALVEAAAADIANWVRTCVA